MKIYVTSALTGAAMALALCPLPALAAGVIDNVNGIALDANGAIVHFGALLIDDMPLAEPYKFAGYRGHPKAPGVVLLRN